MLVFVMMVEMDKIELLKGLILQSLELWGFEKVSSRKRLKKE